MSGIRGLTDRIDGWLLAPQPRAAGNLGIFRVVYCAFCLWELSFRHAAMLSGDALVRQRLLLLLPFPKDLSPIGFGILESMLVAALVLLMIGWRVRVMTVAVLVLGGVLSAYWNAVDVELGDIFVAYLIPAVVIAGGTRWGDTHSLDARLRARRGLPVVDPMTSDGIYAMPARAMLVLLAAQFMSAALCKILGQGTWLRETGIMAFLAAEKNIVAAIDGLPLNPLAPFIARTPWAYHALQYGTLLFEGTFVLALADARLRRLYLAGALVFHAANALWFVVTFTPILIVYPMFVDWQRLARFRPLPALIAPRAVSAIAVLGAVLMGAAWNYGIGLRRAMSLGGLIDWRTIWWPILPVALVAFICFGVGNLIDLARSPHRMGASAVGSGEDDS